MKPHPTLLSTPLKFLVVDDSRAIQAIVSRAITKCGFEPIEIRTALDGEQALDIIESFTPDLVITDWHMPKVSGIELVQALRQMGRQKVRVGFVTTEKTPAMLDQAISNGALFILNKPFNDAELVAVVTAAVKDLAQPVAALAKEEPVPEPPVTVPANTPGPVAQLGLQILLKDRLGNLPFRLIDHDKMTRELLTVDNFLGLYSATNRKGVYAIGVMDTNAVCMVGGGAARKSPADVRAAMASGHPDDLMLSNAHEFLRSVSACLTNSVGDDAVTVTLAKASIVKNTFAKLAEVLTLTGNRSDFRLSVPGYGEGRMGFFLMIP